MNRRSFFLALSAVLPLSLLPQSAVMKDGKAVACEAGSGTFKCGSCGKTSCREIDAFLVVGTGDTSYPNWGEVFNYKLLRCTICGVANLEAK